MRYFFLIVVIFFFQHASAGLTQTTKAEVLKDLPADSAKLLLEKDISTVNARLKVEGALFRPFNLFLAEIKIGAGGQQNAKEANDIRAIVEHDLKITGGFNFVSHKGALDEGLLKQKGVEGSSKITLTLAPESIIAAVEHKNLVTGAASIKPYFGSKKALRKLAHQIAKSIYEEYIGPENLFLLQIAAVKNSTKGSQIVLLDFDGHNEETITDTPWIKNNPFFSLDGKTIFYSAISPQGAGIIEHDISKKRFEFRTKLSGMNNDPRILPNNSGLLATLSFEGNANIYQLSRSGAVIKRLTRGLGLNLSPSINPDGSEFVFVSQRSGTPQIYIQKLDDQAKAEPLLSQGKFNQTPQFSPDGSLVAFTGRDEKRVFDIFLFEKKNERVSRVTENQGRNQEPFFTPSGRFVIFTSEREGKPKPDIFIATLNGSHQYRLTNANAESTSLGYFSPVVRPEQ